MMSKLYYYRISTSQTNATCITVLYKEIKSRAYLTLVRPILEYASPVWDPHLIKDSEQIEKVQQTAARLVSSDYRWSSSISSVLNCICTYVVPVVLIAVVGS